MELIVLNIGLELKVLTPEVFTMMVIMALVTTFMTGPALDLINYLFKNRVVPDAEEITNHSKYRILFSFGNNEKGKSLLRLANSLTKKQKSSSIVTAMHLSLSNELHSFNMDDKEKDSFFPIFEESEVLNIEIETIFKATIDIESEIADVANQGDYDLLLVGLGKSIFEGTILGKVIGFTTRIINPDRLIDKFTGKEGLFENSPFDERTRQIVAKTKMPLGILIDKEFQEIDRVFIPIFKSDDSFLIDYAQKLIYNNNSKITVLDVNGHVNTNFVVQSAVNSLEEKYPVNIGMLEDKIVTDEFLSKQDLMLISLESWKTLLDLDMQWIAGVPSVLIIKP
jgi:hypothetical protein